MYDTDVDDDNVWYIYVDHDNICMLMIMYDDVNYTDDNACV
jgi:hypothetical protein